MKSDANVAVELGNVRLIGRERELAQLAGIAEVVIEGAERHVVTLCGAEGSGKSRMIDELCQRFLERGLFEDRLLRVQALPGDGPNALIARLLRLRFEIDETFVAERQAASLRTHAAEIVSQEKLADVCYFLGGLAAIAGDETPMTRALHADRFRVGVVQQSILASFLEADAAQRPLCLIFEDLHFADYQSLEMVLFLAESLGRSVLLVCTGRSEFFAQRERWTAFGAPRHDLMDLARLDLTETDAMVRELLANCDGGAPEGLRRLVAEYGHGSPRLIEQAVRSLFECGALLPKAGTGLWQFQPERLEEFRMRADRHVDRLTNLSLSEQRVLEYACLVGDSFWLGGLVAVARTEATDRPENEPFQGLALAVHSLQQRGVVMEHEPSILPGERQFSFVHDAERKLVMSGISSERRRQYHRAIGGWLAAAFQEPKDSDIGALVAHHFESCGSRERAAVAYLSAAGAARKQYAPERAAALFGSALKLLTDDDDERRMRALHDQGEVLLSIGRTAEGISAFEIMLHVARQGERTEKIGVAHHRIGCALRQIGRLGEAQKHFQRALEAFTEAGDERGIASTQDDIGRLAWMRGEFDLALREMQAAFEQRKRMSDPRLIALSLNNIGSVFLDRGQLADAEQAFAAALYIRSRIDDRGGQIDSLEAQGELALRLGEYQSAIELLERAQTIAREIQDRARLVPVLALLGHAHSSLGDAERAVSILQVARILAVEIGDERSHGEIQRLLASAYLATHDLAAAADAANMAVAIARSTRSKSLLTRALRTLGTITAAGASGKANEGLAIDHFMRAIALAKETGNELELAKTYRAFCAYAHHFNNPEIRSQVTRLRQMADDILVVYRPRTSANFSVAPDAALPPSLRITQEELAAETARLAS